MLWCAQYSSYYHIQLLFMLTLVMILRSFKVPLTVEINRTNPIVVLLLPLQISEIIEHSIFVREVTGSWFGKRCVIAFESCELAACIYLYVCMCLYVFVEQGSDGTVAIAASYKLKTGKLLTTTSPNHLE